MLRVLVTCLTLAFLTQAAAQPVQERRVALVIGVTDYDSVANLANPREGARRVYEALRSTGFEVDEPLDSPTKAQLDAALLAFSRRADTADVAFLYFAGHGMQQFDDNWLIPRSATLERPSDVRLQGVRLQDVVGLMSGARLRVIILDACRNNPFSARWPSTMSPADGLAEVAAPIGTVLAYSAGPRQLAPDNGVFARALAQNMQMEGLTLRQVLERTRDAVVVAAPSLNPSITYDSNTVPFYFRGGPDAAVLDLSRSSLGAQAFGVAVRRGSSAAYEAYLTRYPEGGLAQLARMMLAPVHATADTWPRGQAPCGEIRGLFFFDWDRTTLSPEALANVDLMTERWRQCGAGRASIFANFTLNSDEHPEADPDSLTTAQLYVRFVRRVVSVRDAFVSRGVPPDSIAQLGVRDPEVVVFERDPQQRYVEITIRFDQTGAN